MVLCSCFPVASQWYSGSADRGSGSLGLANSFEIPVGWYWAMGKTCSQTVWRNPTFTAFPRSVALWILLRVVCPNQTTVCCLQDCLVLCFSLRPAAGELSVESMEDGQAGGTPLMRIQAQDVRSCSEKSHPAKAREATHCLLYFWVTLMRK